MENHKMENQLPTKQEKKKEFKVWSVLLMAVLFFTAAGLGLYSIQLHQKNDALKEHAIVNKQQLRNHFDLTFGELEQNLAAVTAHEGAIRSSMLEDNPKGPRSVEQRVQQEVLIIEALLNQNRAIIADLSAQLGNSNEDLADYAKRNKRLQQKLNVFVTKTQELEALSIQLARDLNQSEADKAIFEKDLLAQVAYNDELSEHILAKDNKIFKLEKTVNTSYYVVGEFKELRDLDVVEREGGILGVGGAKTLKDDFNAGQFIEIDRANYTTIPVFAKRAKLATNHPSDSYKWVESENGIQWLEITNQVKFWMSSKYLVVLTEKEISLAG
jgi:hypothetical protein